MPLRFGASPTTSQATLVEVIDLHQLRADPDGVKASLARRGVEAAVLDEVLALDAKHRGLLGSAEELRHQVKAISKEVGQAKRSGNEAEAERLAAESRSLGEQERAVSQQADDAFAEVRAALLVIPNLPAAETPDGLDESCNVELRRWWPGMEEGSPEPTYAEHQRVAHWDVGEELGILDLERGAAIAGSMFPMFRGDGSRLLRALSAFALDAHADAYEEIRPPTFALTEVLTATGHLPKFSEEAYAIERDDLWAIPTAEVPLTSMHRGEIVAEADLPLRFTALTACFRREAGAAGRDTRGLLRVHEFDKVELFAYTTPEQAHEVHADVLARAEAILRALGITYRVLDLCCGDIGGSARRTFDLEAYSPGVDRWLEVSSVSWFGDYQARRAQVRYRPEGGGQPQLTHTVNGSALAWARIWAVLVEQGRQADGSVQLPTVLSPYLGGRTTISAG